MEVIGATFTDNTVELSYTEDHEVNTSVRMVRLIMVDNDLVRALLEDVLDTLRTIVDEGLISLRNPAQTKQSPEV